MPDFPIENDRVTKAKLEALFSVLLNRSRLGVPVDLESSAYDFIILLCKSLPIVFSELGKENQPKFQVMELKAYNSGSSHRTLHIWSTAIGKTGKERGWVPLTKSTIFKSTKIGATDSKKKRVLAALRLAIKGQTDVVRYSTPIPFTCPLSGKIVTKRSDFHVDHFGQFPFIKIVELWLNLLNTTYDNIQLDRKGLLKDPDIFKSWYGFHGKTADLRSVCKTANMRKGAKGN